MSIGAIGSSFSSQQSQQIDEMLKTRLKALGLQSTGSVQGDLALLKSAQSGQSQSSSASQTDNANKVSTQIQASSQAQQLPWASLMNELGVKPTGSKEGDFAAISSAIEVKSSQATTTEQKSEVKALQQEFASIQSQNDSNSTQSVAQAASPSAQSQQSNYTGQNQVAELNKYFLLNKNV